MALGNLVRYPRPARRIVRRGPGSAVPLDFDRIGFNRVFDDLWGGFGLAPVVFPVRSDVPPSFDPRFEAEELETEYRISADMPGVEPSDLEVSVEDGVLIVKGRRHYEDETSEDGEVARLEERGRFERRIRFPGDIVEGDVKASLKHGVLKVTIPKPEEAKAEAEVRSIPVETA